MPDCTATCPQGDTPCAGGEHPQAFAHRAAGTTADGTHWIVTWWNPREDDGGERPTPLRDGPDAPRIPRQGSWAPPRGRRYVT